MRASPGPIEALLEARGVGRRGEESRPSVLSGLVGRGIQASRTPAMHEREGARLGLACTYVLIDFDQLGLSDATLGDIVAEAEHIGFSGLNVTHPFKQTVLPRLGSLSAEAEAIGAVNTIVFPGEGATSGHNTDSWGFAESFRQAMPGVVRDRVVQFGAGGAGAAVAYALLELGVEELTLIDSLPERAAVLVERLKPRFPGRLRSEADPAASMAEADGVVNTTPIGMTKYPGMPFEKSLLDPRQWVAEIVYFPATTELLRYAQSIGCPTMPGTGMAVLQAVRAFELFTGRKPDSAAMASHFEAAA